MPFGDPGLAAPIWGTAGTGLKMVQPDTVTDME